MTDLLLYQPESQIGQKSRNFIYLDTCATTPVRPVVRNAMLAVLEQNFGNPSSMHWAGQQAAKLIQLSRQAVAAGIHADVNEILFTSGATEADNLALFGILRQYAPGEAHLITTSIEHHAVLHAASQLEKEGYAVTYLPVNSQGLADPEDVKKALRKETVLISVMLVNNEMGAIQPVREIGAIARERGIWMHTDAVQGTGLLDVDVTALNVDLLSLSAHKIYGPKGIGALYVRSGIPLQPLLFGGPQEMQLRPGTENVPGIAGLGAAMKCVSQTKAQEYTRLRQLRHYLIEGLREHFPTITINGPEEFVSPHILSLSIPGTDAEMMIIRLNGEGIAVSLGSACNSSSIEPSHVLKAMGLAPTLIDGTLRISTGIYTTQEELEVFLSVLPEIAHRSRV